MPRVQILTKNPGLQALAAKGPAITIIESLIQAQTFSSGRVVVLVVGAVVNDQGLVNVPTQLENRASDLSAKFGGWAAWLGDGLAAGEAGHTSGYEGNLYARVKGADFPVFVLLIPDMALRDKTITDSTGVNLTITLTRSDAANGAVAIPAGTRIKPAAGSWTVATLEDVAYDTDETGDKAVRVRSASDTGVTPVAMNTLDTFVENGLLTCPEDANITVKTASASSSPPDTPDNTEIVERYKAAIDRALVNTPGRAADIVVTDRDESDIGDYVAAHCSSAATRGFNRIAVLSPPKGTSATDARGNTGDGVGRSTLDRERVVQVHPGVQRKFSDDADNLAADLVATLPGAVLAAARIADCEPWENPGAPGSKVFSRYGVVGEEDLGGSPDLVTHFQAGLLQLDSSVDTQGVTYEYYDGIMAYIPSGSTRPQTIDARRMTDYLEKGFVRAVRPWHKALALERNRNFTAAAMEALLAAELSENDPSARHIRAFSTIVPVWDADLEVAIFPVTVQFLGSQRQIVIPFTAGTGVIAAG